jgi:nucleoside-diphosphate-sugar epimerase
MLRHLNERTERPARVVILGAGGFLSPHLQSALRAAGIPFRAVGSRELDLRRPDASASLARIFAPHDTVVMASALTPNHGRNYGVLMNNLQMAATVCQTLEAIACGHFIYLSSDAVYDADRTPLDEESSREPTDLYALTHTAREMMLGSVLTARAIPHCFLRPTNVYGPGDTHDNYGPNRFVRTALSEGRITLFGRGEERRSHLFVRDAVGLIVRVIGRRSVGTLNLAKSPAISYRRVAEAVVRHCPAPVAFDLQPRKVSPVHRPYKPLQVFRFLSRLGRGISPIVHRPYAVSAIFKAFPDFQYTPLDEGIAACVKDLRERAPVTAPVR